MTGATAQKTNHAPCRDTVDASEIPGSPPKHFTERMGPKNPSAHRINYQPQATTPTTPMAV